MMLVIEVLTAPVVTACLAIPVFAASVGWGVAVGVGRMTVAVLVGTAVGVEITIVAVWVGSGDGVTVTEAGLSVAVTTETAVTEAAATDSAPSAASLPQPEMKIAARHNLMPTASRCLE
jgi:hypothetical protein